MLKNDTGIPEEQRGCARNSHGSKDQLLINKMIIEDCKKKKKILSMVLGFSMVEYGLDRLQKSL